MSLSPDEIRQLIDVLANSSWDEAVITVGETTIAVARNGARLADLGGQPAAPAVALAHAPEAASNPAAADERPSGTAETAVPQRPAGSASEVEVASPSVGVFWRAPQPGTAPFVEAGQRVDAGQEMCIVEVMKLMNRVSAPVAGVVSGVHVANGAAVQFGTVLFTIMPG
jgi:acetyl-CoA carboxylase biotin carboxyl carrier protein